MRAAVLAATLFLAACQSTDLAGITTVDCSQDEEDGILLTACRVESGKEYDSIAVAATLPDGTTLEWKGDTIRAFEGQRIAAEVQKALIDAGVKITPEIAKAITTSVTRAIGLP